MPNLVEVNYKQTGKSLNTNDLGMREMQERAFEKRNAQYLLLKAPPASGKSRALMFLGLDKLFNQGQKKVIVSVPERSIGASFDVTKLTEDGFFADWEYDLSYNLCTPYGSDQTKADKFKAFIEDKSATILICAHATLRNAFGQIEINHFNDLVLAIDEFHHVSASEDSKLGEVLRAIMKETNAHVIAMTGTYFRGDTIPVLMPEDEAKFEKVTYNYYQQLNGYKHLKSLGIGYHFYQGKYTSAIGEVLDVDKKTIVHIPSPNANASTKDKYKEVNLIIDIIGEVINQDSNTGVIHVKRHDNGEVIKIADLVNDDPKTRDRVIDYLRTMKNLDDIDIIIALGMAKEGFDWPYCEHCLTIGHRGSLTELIQIIGRTTRDSSNKTHAQFTNLISQPDANDEDVTEAVNNMLKAITASLLMEQVLAPKFNFLARGSDEGFNEGGNIYIGGFKPPKSKKVKKILEEDLHDLKAVILQDTEMQKAMTGSIEPEVINQSIIPKIIMTKYPDLSKEEVEEVRQTIIADSAIKTGAVKVVGGKQFLTMAGKFVEIEDLDMELIDSVNPFQKAYEVMSKNVTPKLLKLIGDTIAMQRITVTTEEATILYKKIPTFIQEHKREPDINSHDPLEKRMAEAIILLKNMIRDRQSN